MENFQRNIDNELKERRKILKKESNYYHATMTPDEAEKRLLEHYKCNKIDGCFVVRPCASSQNDYSLSLVYDNQYTKYLIKHISDSYFKIKDDPAVNGIDRLIQNYQKNQKSLCCPLSQIFIPGELLPIHTRTYGVKNLLHETVAKVNEINKLKLILNSQFCPDINERDEDGRTALDIACEYDNVAAIEEIMKKKPLMNLKAIDNYTPLHRAAEHNSINAIEYLLSNGHADPTERLIDNKYVPLHTAVGNGNFMCVKMLLRFNIADKPRTSDDKTPLDIAIEKGYNEIIENLTTFKPQGPKIKLSEFLHEDASVNREIAYKILFNAKEEFGDGVFLVRRKSKKLHVLSVMLKNEFFNYEIFFKEDEKYFFIDDGPYFCSLEHVIEYYLKFKDGFPDLLRSPIGANSVHCQNLSKVAPYNPGGNGAQKSNKLRSTEKLLSTTVKPLPQLPKKTCASDIALEEIIGQGEFGTVYRATLFKNKQVAVKKLKDYSAIKEFEREAKIMQELGNHPCVVRIFHIIKEKDDFMIVQELLVCSLLQKLYELPCIITDYNLKSWAIEIVSGMQHMEKKKIVHRDLAARNILLGSNLQAKISDFGLSRAFEGDEYTQTTNYKIPLKWYAPESIERCRFTSKSDVWSYGITLYEMWSYGEIPYGEKNGVELYEFIKSGKRLSQPKDCLNSTYEIMMKCWEWNEEYRPSFEDLAKIFKKLTSKNNDYADVNSIYM